MARLPLLLACVFAMGCFLAPYFSAQRLILPTRRRRRIDGCASERSRRGHAAGDGAPRPLTRGNPDRGHRCRERPLLRRRDVLHLVSDPRHAGAEAPAGRGDRGVRRSPGRYPLPVPRPAATRPDCHSALPEPVRPDAHRVAAGARVRRVRRRARRSRPSSPRSARARSWGASLRSSSFRSSIRSACGAVALVCLTIPIPLLGCRSPLAPSSWCCS